MLFDRGNPYEMLQLVKELDHAGEITASKSYSFEFGNCPKNHETYNGHNVRLRYFLRVKITRHMAYDITKTVDFAVQNVMPDPEVHGGRGVRMKGWGAWFREGSDHLMPLMSLDQ
eukprot:1390716-Amorphochlora_amoeboformis.AAC.4